MCSFFFLSTSSTSFVVVVVVVGTEREREGGVVCLNRCQISGYELNNQLSHLILVNLRH